MIDFGSNPAHRSATRPRHKAKVAASSASDGLEVLELAALSERKINEYIDERLEILKGPDTPRRPRLMM